MVLLSKDNVEKHLKNEGFGFLVLAIKRWEEINYRYCSQIKIS